MQKIEFIINGPEEKPCADLINDLARAAMGHFNVVPVKTYCGRAPVKSGLGELLVPDFMRCRAAEDRGKATGRKAVPRED